MTRIVLSLIAILGLIAVAAFPVLAGAQGEAKELSVAELKTMVENMGYTTKELSKDTGKFEFTITKEGLDIPIAAEVSGSKRYVWLTVFLGDFGKLSDQEARAVKMLKQNFKIQPSQFYVTEKGNLMMAMPLDNRTINAAVLRRCTDKLSNDVSSTKELWQ